MKQYGGKKLLWLVSIKMATVFDFRALTKVQSLNNNNNNNNNNFIKHQNPK